MVAMKDHHHRLKVTAVQIPAREKHKMSKKRRNDCTFLHHTLLRSKTATLLCIGTNPELLPLSCNCNYII